MCEIVRYLLIYVLPKFWVVGTLHYDDDDYIMLFCHDGSDLVVKVAHKNQPITFVRKSII